MSVRPELAIVALFAIAAAVALVARRLRIPYTVALVLAGIGLGAAKVLHAPHLTRELLYAVFLPGLVFEAAFHLELRRYWANKLAIHALAVPGVVLAIVFTSLALMGAGRMGIADFGARPALLFGALIAATDPIAVVALFKTLGAPKRLSVLVEGESLLNDGTSIVLFTIILAAVTGGDATLAHGALEFVKVVGLGLALGAAIGFVSSKVIELVDEPMIAITVTTAAAYGSFLVAEELHFSGVIATVAAGMICGNRRLARRAAAASTSSRASRHLAVEAFWEYVAFALNSLVFLLIGLEVEIASVLAAYKPVVFSFVTVVVVRAAIVFLVSALLRATSERLPWRWSVMVTWGGLRGALSMVLVLALPQGFERRELLVTVTFGVVLLSIVLQGATAAPMLRALGLAASRD